MAIVEEAGTHLEYTVAADPSDPTKGKLQARAIVRPGNIRNHVWFSYRLDGHSWVTKEATRQRSPVTEDRFLLTISVSETDRILSLYGFVRRASKTIPRRVGIAGVDPASLKDLFVEVDLRSDGREFSGVVPSLPSAVTAPGKEPGSVLGYPSHSAQNLAMPDRGVFHRIPDKTLPAIEWPTIPPPPALPRPRQPQPTLRRQPLNEVDKPGDIPRV